jgi:TonB family protein
MQEHAVRPLNLLPMRQTEPREHHVHKDEHEALTSESSDGVMRPNEQRQEAVAARERRANVPQNDKKLSFRLSSNDMDAIFGKHDTAHKSFESRQQSKNKGVWDEARAHWQSPLENMVPEVKVGNQTALRSRKHPFAQYIATIHRSIHDAWAWGFLDQLDTQSRDHPLNKRELWTRVEIIVNADGSIDKVTTVRFSGTLAFDAAAREVVYAIGPLPPPPNAIMSGNGKVYMHWAFHRDERACGTFGAQPFILDNAGHGDRPDPNVPVRAGRGQEKLGRRLKPSANAGPVGPVLPPGYRPAQKAAASGSGSDAATEHAGDGGHGAPEDAPVLEAEARTTANTWLYHFHQGNVDKVISRSSLPFMSGSTVAARSRVELSDLIATMSAEARQAGKPKATKLYTAAGLRKLYGSVPAGVQEGDGRIFALTRIGSEYVILMLEKRFGTWKVVGVSR